MRHLPLLATHVALTILLVHRMADPADGQLAISPGFLDALLLTSR